MTHPKVDTTQKDIVKALKDAGAQVVSLGRVKDGVPDLLVGFGGVNYLIECKSPGGALEPEQRAFHAAWKGRSVIVAYTPAEALLGIGANDG